MRTRYLLCSSLDLICLPMTCSQTCCLFLVAMLRLLTLRAREWLDAHRFSLENDLHYSRKWRLDPRQLHAFNGCLGSRR